MTMLYIPTTWRQSNYVRDSDPMYYQTKYTNHFWMAPPEIVCCLCRWFILTSRTAVFRRISAMSNVRQFLPDVYTVGGLDGTTSANQ